MADVEKQPGPRLLRLHSAVDSQVRKLVARHRDRLRCGPGCSSCCVDDITVFAVEADRIRVNHPALLATGAPHPAGACAFLDEAGSCRVYADRPYVCRTEGLPLRWYRQQDDGTLADGRDLCALNQPGEPLHEIDADDCWLIGPWEERLRDLQIACNGSPQRVALRDLFGRRD